MTRACEDLARFRRSGMFGEDWPAACETANNETGTPLDESAWSTAAEASETTSGAWGPSPEGDAPRSEASVLGASRLSPARLQPPDSCHPLRDEPESCFPAAAQAWETTVDGSPSTVHADRRSSGENTDNQSDAPPGESLCPGRSDRAGVGQPFQADVRLERLTYDTQDSAVSLPSQAAARTSKPTACFPRPIGDDNAGHLNALLLVACIWSFAGSDYWAAFRGSQSSAALQALAVGSPPVAPSLEPLRAGVTKTRPRRDAGFPSPRRGEGARRAGEGAGADAQQERRALKHRQGPFQADFSSPDADPAGTEIRVEPTAASVTGDPRSDHEHRTMKNELPPQNKAKAICAGRAGSAERLTVAPPTGNARRESEETGERRPTRSEPSARNKAMATGSDSVESSAQVRSALTRQSANSAPLILDRSFRPLALAPVPQGRGSPEQRTTNHRGTPRE